MKHADIGYGGYVAVWAGLVILAVGTFVTSRFVQGGGEVIAALAFAFAKAFLVVWFFMHMAHEGVASRFSFLTAVVLVVVLLGFVLGDVLLRPDLQIHVPLSR